MDWTKPLRPMSQHMGPSYGRATSRRIAPNRIPAENFRAQESARHNRARPPARPTWLVCRRRPSGKSRICARGVSGRHKRRNILSPRNLNGRAYPCRFSSAERSQNQTDRHHHLVQAWDPGSADRPALCPALSAEPRANRSRMNWTHPPAPSRPPDESWSSSRLCCSG